MPYNRFGIWSPHRNSSSVRAFKAAISLRPENWQWYDDMHQAAWWILDGTQVTPSGLTDALHQQKMNAPIQGAILAPSWIQVEDPAWTFFKIPVNVKLIYGWIDRCLQQQEPPPVWTGQQFKLSRWPNLTHYSDKNSATDGVYLALVCARLLEDWTRYEEALAIVRHAPLLDRLLTGTLRDGIAQSQPAAPAGMSPPPLVRSPTDRPEKRDAWSLVKRLISKFS